MAFRSKTEAYSSALLLLTRMRKKVEADLSDEQAARLKAIDACLANIKKAMENHEQDVGVVNGYLQSLLTRVNLSSEDQRIISKLQKDINSSSYKQTAKGKYENPLARRAESEIGVTLLQDPTSAMMTSVKRVSDELLKLMDDMGDGINPYLYLFAERSHVIALGSFKEIPTAAAIRKILEENDPTKLAEIMHIHFKFAQGVTREVPIRHAPVRDPVGKLAEVIKSKWPGMDPKDFFSKEVAKGWDGRQYRAYISDELMYNSPLYTAIRGRGRAGVFDSSRTQQLGLMLKGQEEFEVGLPKHSSSWAADCKSQPADLESPYVLDLIENDAVYVAGPSGMTSMFLGQMEFMANFEDENLKKNYLSAVVAYIVGGGFHSLHEVIGPAENALGLVPGYNVQVPQFGKLAPPPNYNQFFSQQESIDPEFKERHERAWQKYMTFCNDSYAPRYLEDIHVEPDVQIEKHKIPEELKAKVMAEINNYIKDGVLSRGTSYEKSQLSFISQFFRNNELTRAKLDIARDFRTKLQKVESIEELHELVGQVKVDNKKVELAAGKSYGLFTKSGLERSMNHIDTMIESYTEDQEKNMKLGR